jgi:hypothetical protein
LALPNERLGGVFFQQNHRTRSIPSPLSHQTPSPDRNAGLGFVNALSVQCSIRAWRNFSTSAGHTAMGQVDYLFVVRS